MATITDSTLGNIATLAQRQYFSRPADQRFENIDLLEQAVLSRRNRAIEFDTDIKRFKFVNDNGLIVAQARSVDEPAVPTHYSFGQVAGLVGAPAGWLRSLGEAGQTDLVVSNLNAGLALRAEDGVKAYVIEPDDPENGHPELRAVTSQTYGRIWDADVVGAARRILDAHPEFVNPLEWSGKRGGLYASDRDCFLFYIDGGSIVDGGADLLNGGDRDQLHRGWILLNSEVGTSTFCLLSFLFRTVCGNHLITGIEGVKLLKIRHTSGGPARFVNEAIPALTEYVNSSAKPIETAIRSAKTLLLPAWTEGAKDNPFQTFFLNKGFTKAEIKRAKAYAEAEEGGSQTLWQVQQGFTRAARDLAFIDARTDLEKRAGKLLSLVADAPAA
jgi:hypothetical protein